MEEEAAFLQCDRFLDTRYYRGDLVLLYDLPQVGPVSEIGDIAMDTYEDEVTFRHFVEIIPQLVDLIIQGNRIACINSDIIALTAQFFCRGVHYESGMGPDSDTGDLHHGQIMYVLG